MRPIIFFDFVKYNLQIISEADPDLKGARRLLSKQNRPILSEVCLFFLIDIFMEFNLIY